MRFSFTRLTTGPQIRYAEEGDASGEPVVFLHGWPDSSFSYSRVIPLLPRHYRSIAPDQRGFGDSERPEHEYSIAGMADDVAALLDAASIERATLVGHSLGSFIARRVAIAHPHRVARLALIGSGWSTVSPVTLEVEESISDLADPVPIEFAREFQASTIYKPIPDDFFEGLLAESIKAPAWVWRQVFDGFLKYDDRPDLGRIEARALLIWGERDALFPREDQERLVAAIPDADLKFYPDIGHCPNWECPEQVAADLATFIASE